MAAEAIILDPSEVATGRAELTLHPATGHGSIMIREEGPDWGDAEISAYLAELERGEVPVDFRIPNRRITIPLLVQERGAVTFNQAREQLQQKIGLLQREGGWLKRQMADGREVFLDVVNATLKFGGGFHQARHSIDDSVSLILDAIPDFYGDEIALDQKSETTLPELVTVLQIAGVNTVIKGDYPGRVRIVVDELDADDQLGLLWAFRSRYYSSDPTAALAYQAEALTPLDTAAIAALSGASGSGSNTVRHQNLATSWTPVLNTNLVSGGAFLTHVGTYRAFARVYSPDPGVQLRLVWDVGDLSMPAENAPVNIPLTSHFCVVDLGEVNLGRVPIGAHRWQGQIHAKGAVGSEDIYIDRLMLQPVAEAAGRVIAAPASLANITTISARDDFTGTTVGAAVSGRTPQVGAAWATAGAATDFAFADGPDGGETISRSTTSDTGQGRFAVFGPTQATQAIRADFRVSAWPSTAQGKQCGAILRYVDANNFVAGIVRKVNGATSLIVGVMLAGSFDITGGLAVDDLTPDAWYRMELYAFPSGRVEVRLLTQSGLEVARNVRIHSAAATGGALDDGRAGVIDDNGSTTAFTRYFDNIVSAVPVNDAVMFASQSAELRTDGMFREDSSGAAYGPLADVWDDLPRIPPSGLEGRPVELFLKGSRGNFDDLPDHGIDDIRAQVFYRPSWTFVPGA